MGWPQACPAGPCCSRSAPPFGRVEYTPHHGWLLPCCPLPTAPQRAKPGSRLQRVPILRNVSSVLRPGRLTLLLGPPGSGKSMLMRALCGQLKRESRLKVTGKLHALRRCAVLRDGRRSVGAAVSVGALVSMLPHSPAPALPLQVTADELT